MKPNRSLLFKTGIGVLLLLAACSKSPQQWLDFANAKAREGKHADAVGAYDKALAGKVENSDAAQLGKARSQLALKQYPQAAQSALLAEQGTKQPAAAQQARLTALQAYCASNDSTAGAKVIGRLPAGTVLDSAMADCAKKWGASVPAAAAPSQGFDKTVPQKEVGKLDAVRIGVRGIEQAQSLDLAAFPLVVRFQDPRVLTKVPSPDGKHLVWRGLDKQGYALFLSDANGANEKRLPGAKNGYQPVWSPDGSQLLFSAMDWKTEARNLFLYDIKSGKSLRAFNAKKKVSPLASFSPDGKKILFTYFDDLWMMNANGIGRSLLNVSGMIKKPISDPVLIAWAKDGSAFAYQMKGEPTYYVVRLSSRI